MTDKRTAAMRDPDNPYNPAGRKNASHPNSRHSQWIKAEEERQRAEEKQNGTAEALGLPESAVKAKDGRLAYAREIARATGVSVCHGGDEIDTAVGSVGFSIKSPSGVTAE